MSAVLDHIGRPIGNVYTARTNDERIAGVTPAHPEYAPGNLLRYVDDLTLASDCTDGIEAWLASNYRCYAPAGSYRNTGFEIPAQRLVYGDGPKATNFVYTSTSGNAISLGGDVIDVRDLKVSAATVSSGWAYWSDPDLYNSDIRIDGFEIEGFAGGIYIPFGLQITIGTGRGLGRSSVTQTPPFSYTHFSGGIGIQLGDRTLPAGSLGTRIVNRGTVVGSYMSLYETSAKMHGDILNIEDATLEFGATCIECASILAVENSWLQAETTLFQTYAGGWEIGAYTNKYFDDQFNALDDIASVCTLTTSPEELSIFQKSEFRGAGRFRYRFATSADRGIQIGSDATPVVYSPSSGLLRLDGVLTVNGSLSLLSVSEYADDAAASAGGIAVGGVYRTGSALKVRVS